MLNKNTCSVKKCEVKKNQRLKGLISNNAKKSVNESATYIKALISTRAKKFIPSQLFVTNFHFKDTNNLQGVLLTMIGFVTLGHLLFRGSCKKRWPRVTKPIMVGKTPCKLLCAFEVKVSSK